MAISESDVRYRAWAYISPQLAAECNLSFEVLKGFISDKVVLSSDQIKRLDARIRVLETRDLAEPKYD